MNDITTGGYAFIYKIFPKGNELSDECYIGSTTKSLEFRLRGHKSNYKRYLNGKYTWMSSFDLFDKYGIDGVEICGYEVYKFDDKADLRKREGQYIQSFECVNKFVAGRTPQEYDKQWYQNNPEYNKQYYQINRDQILKQQKQYHQKNRDASLIKMKQYREANRDQIKKQQKHYREANRDIINSKIICECGCIVSKVNLSRHQKSNKHLELMNSKQ